MGLPCVVPFEWTVAFFLIASSVPFVCWHHKPRGRERQAPFFVFWARTLKRFFLAGKCRFFPYGFMRVRTYGSGRRRSRQAAGGVRACLPCILRVPPRTRSLQHEQRTRRGYCQRGGVFSHAHVGDESLGHVHGGGSRNQGRTRGLVERTEGEERDAIR